MPFAVYDPTSTPTLTIVGHVAAPRLKAGETFAWKVQVAPCLEPAEADFTDVPGGSGTTAKDGVLATWDPADHDKRDLHAAVPPRASTRSRSRAPTPSGS